MIVKAKYGEYFIENNVIPKLNLIAKRVTKPSPKFDYPFIIDGYEGYGKSNLGVGYLNYLAQLTNRDFGLDEILFKPKEMLDLSLRTKENILMLDESALSLLASDRKGSSFQLEIIKMLNVARKKRHIMAFCIPRFWRLKEPIIERCMGLFHVYSKSEKDYFRFRFHKKSQLEWLYEKWKKSKLKPNFAKRYCVRGSFAEALPKVIDEKAYDKKKDEAMIGILDDMGGKKEQGFNNMDINNMVLVLKKSLHYLKEKGLESDFCERTNTPRKTSYNYGKVEIPPLKRKRITLEERNELFNAPLLV